ncbi:MAG: PepSY-like domain-containing protein [Haliscomenobacter sp.]|uniref:PepSY-like domain-containing protein n=1 Tax=Haliscomenobacter sp. TaxID=2717303 RepID=UPI0029A835A9|nr:PepSY-like domain-containing protein [Haliscomenobacter sp.]MDX2068061.1 PepSY-like domain-containing protein [Haliscomenobacter sp.]
MKKFFFAWFITALAVGMSSCNKESFTVSAEELFKLDGSVNVFCAGKTSTSFNKLPIVAQEYLQKNYSDFTTQDVYVFTQDSSLFYGVELKKVGTEKKILFNAKGELISIGDDNERSEYYLADKIPANIKAYLQEKFPNVGIKEVELKHEYGLAAFKIELSNDVKITFSKTGEMWCSGKSSDDDSNEDKGDDDDDDDDDDNSNGNGTDDNSNSTGSISLTTIPDSLKQFITSKYPGYVAYEAEKEDLCDGLYVLKIGVKKGSDELHLMFDLKGKFLFDAIRISATTLPPAVSNVLKTQYPTYTFKDDKSIEQLRYPDGSKRYYVRLRSSAGKDLRLMLGADGSLVCQKTSSSSSDDNTGGSGSGNGSGSGSGSGNSGGTDDNSNNGGSGSNGSGNSGGSDDNSNSTVNVSTTIKNFVSSKYAGYTIYEVEKEDWCDDQYLIEVGIKNGSKEVHLVFDLNEKFLFEAKRIGEAALPSAVANAIKTQFSGYKVKDDNDVEELTYADGSKRYYVRLRKSSGGGGSDVRVMFNANGTVFCQKK